MATSNDGYFKRSWALLTRDDGWIKPVLVLAAARLIPIVGWFGTNGYALEWARLTSWGIDSSPKQKNVNVGACIKTGAKAFVVALGYYVVMFVIQAAFESMFGDAFGGLLSLASGIIFSVLIYTAELRATIYQNIVAGYEIPRIFDMVKRDWKGLLRICGMYALFVLALGILAGVVSTFVILLSFGSIIDIVQVGYYDEAELVRMAFSALAAAMPFLFVSIYATGIVSNLTMLMTCTSLGLWMRQFDVQRWGESSDPLPTPAPQNASEASREEAYPASGSYVEPQPAEPTTQTWVSGEGAQPAASNNASVHTDTWADVTRTADAPAAHEVPLITPPPASSVSPTSSMAEETDAVQMFSLSDDSGLSSLISQGNQSVEDSGDAPVQTFQLTDTPRVSEDVPTLTISETPSEHDSEDTSVEQPPEVAPIDALEQPDDVPEYDARPADAPKTFTLEVPEDERLASTPSEDEPVIDIRHEDDSAEMETDIEGEDQLPESGE